MTRYRTSLGIAALLMLVSCVAPNVPNNSKPVDASEIRYWHDDAHNVSCWLWGNGPGSYTAAISCLPDAEVTR